MNIAAEKADIIRRFNDVHDAGLIKAIKSLLDFGLNRQGVEDEVYDDRNDPELRAAIHEAIEDGEAGRERSYEEFMGEVRKRYRA